MTNKLSEKWWFWVIPIIIILSIFYLFPLLNVIRFSFTNMRVGRPDYSYTLNSFISVLTDEDLWQVLKVTFIFVGGSVILQLGLGLLTALLINKELPGAFMVKLSMISAWVVPGIITGILWQMMYSSSSWGVLNNFISYLGFNKIPFLYNSTWALFAVTLANVWRGTGFSGIMQYAGLRTIPPQLYEAASIDGASGWQSFIYITLPQLRPMLLVNVVLITIYTFNTYGAIYSLTRGGPGSATTVLSLKTYRAVFRYLQLGRGSVYAIIMLLLSAIFTIIYVKIGREED